MEINYGKINTCEEITSVPRKFPEHIVLKNECIYRMPENEVER